MKHTFGAAGRKRNSYFELFAQALKKQRFEKWYIDAFAGTGQRDEVKRRGSRGRQLFGGDANEVADVKDGSARIALGIDPPFERYIFIDCAKGLSRRLRLYARSFPRARSTFGLEMRTKS
jgi:three-Cys-motif partner protein